MGILLWLVFGLIVGMVARWIVPGEGPGGFLGDILVGVVGAFVGGFVYNFFGHAGVTGFNFGSFVCAVVGAVILLWVLRAFTGGRRSAA